MATNALGAGTRNMPINAPLDWWAAIGRQAHDMGISAGELVRDLVERGARLQFPTLASQLHEAKCERLRMKGGIACLAIGLLSVACAMFGNMDLRRASGLRAPRPSHSRRFEA